MRSAPLPLRSSRLYALCLAAACSLLVACNGDQAPVAAAAPVEQDSLRMREPGPAPKAAAKHSPASSLEHQRRVERIPQLRAPNQYRNR